MDQSDDKRCGDDESCGELQDGSTEVEGSNNKVEHGFGHDLQEHRSMSSVRSGYSNRITSGRPSFLSDSRRNFFRVIQLDYERDTPEAAFDRLAAIAHLLKYL